MCHAEEYLPSDGKVKVVCGIGEGVMYDRVDKVIRKLYQSGRVTHWEPQHDFGAIVVTVTRCL